MGHEYYNEQKVNRYFQLRIKYNDVDSCRSETPKHPLASLKIVPI